MVAGERKEGGFSMEEKLARVARAEGGWGGGGGGGAGAVGAAISGCSGCAQLGLTGGKRAVAAQGQLTGAAG